MKGRTLFIVLFFLLLSVLLTFGKPGGKKKPSTPFEKRMKNRKEEIKKTFCNHLGEDLLFNCQLYHLHPECFVRVFGEYGLEWGELPQYNKENEYNECYKKSFDTAKNAQAKTD